MRALLAAREASQRQRQLAEDARLAALLQRQEPGGAAGGGAGAAAREDFDDEIEEIVNPAGARFGGVAQSGAADNPAARRARAAAAAQRAVEERMAGMSAMERRMMEQMERDRERYERMAREARIEGSWRRKAHLRQARGLQMSLFCFHNSDGILRRCLILVRNLRKRRLAPRRQRQRRRSPAGGPSCGKSRCGGGHFSPLAPVSHIAPESALRTNSTTKPFPRALPRLPGITTRCALSPHLSGPRLQGVPRSGPPQVGAGGGREAGGAGAPGGGEVRSWRRRRTVARPRSSLCFLPSSLLPWRCYVRSPCWVARLRCCGRHNLSLRLFAPHYAGAPRRRRSPAPRASARRPSRRSGPRPQRRRRRCCRSRLRRRTRAS